MVFQGGKFNYSAGTVAIAALAEYGRSIDSNDSSKFFVMANKLRSLMGDDGALRYPYAYRHYTSTQAMAAGWTSGMDQGMAMSVFARAYAVSNDEKWLAAGEVPSNAIPPWPTDDPRRPRPIAVWPNILS